MTPTAFYLLFILGLAFFLAGLFRSDHQQAFILHLFSFGFNLVVSLTAHDLHIPTSTGIQTVSENYVFGGIALGLCVISAACLVYRGGVLFAEQGSGPL